MARVALVTGANKGIGYEIVRGLCEDFDGIVYLTSRVEQRGKDALQKLTGGNSSYARKLRYQQLDVSDRQTIERVKDHILENHGGLDILVNNAGIAYQSDANVKRGTLDYKKSEEIINTNFFGLLHVCEILFPILSQNANVVHMSSTLGKLSRVGNDAIRKRLVASDCTVQEICDFMHDYLKCVREGETSLEQAGWPNSAYAVSKVGVTALARVQQRELDHNHEKKRNIVVNACCPGWCKTDLTFGRGLKTPEAGADTPLYLALFKNNGETGNRDGNLPRGQLVHERKILNWARE